MSYTASPQTLAAAYRPLVFRNSRTTADDVQRLKVEVYVGGSLKATFRKDYFDLTGTTYLFDIDVQSIVAREIAPSARAITSIFQTFDDYTTTGNTDAIASYYVTTYIEKLNGDGLIETDGATGETSSTLYAIPASRPASDSSLKEYYNDTATSYFKFLTDVRSERKVATNENVFLAYIGKGTDALRFQFTTTGGMVQTSIIDVGNASANTEMLTASVGPAQIFGSSPSMHSGTMPASPSGIVSYTVSAGTFSGSYTRETEEITFVLQPPCDWGLTLYWMGSTGGPEGYTFKGDIVSKVRTSGDVGEIAQSWTPGSLPNMYSYDRGIIKTDITQSYAREVSESMHPTTAEEIKSLFTSPEVYAYIDSDLYPCVITSSEVQYGRTKQANAEVKFTIQLGGDPVQQL